MVMPEINFKKLTKRILLGLAAFMAVAVVLAVIYFASLFAKINYMSHETAEGFDDSRLVNSDSGEDKIPSEDTASRQTEEVIIKPGKKKSSGGPHVPYVPPILKNLTPIVKVAQKDPDIMNILLLGLDGSDARRANRSDSMIMVSINSKSKTLKLVSFMRDQYITMPYWSKGHKLNEAYVFGGPGNTINAINYKFGLDIQKYVVVDLNNFVSVIDAVGGIDINVTKSEVPNIRGIAGPGLQTLNGAQALEYSRIRKIDSDFMRVQRQRNVISALTSKFWAADLLKKNEALNMLMPLIITNMRADEVLNVAVRGVGNLNSISEYTCPKSGFYTTTWDGGYYIFTDFKSQAADLHKFIYG